MHQQSKSCSRGTTKITTFLSWVWLRHLPLREILIPVKLIESLGWPRLPNRFWLASICQSRAPANKAPNCLAMLSVKGHLTASSPRSRRKKTARCCRKKKMTGVLNQRIRNCTPFDRYLSEQSNCFFFLSVQQCEYWRYTVSSVVLVNGSKHTSY